MVQYNQLKAAMFAALTTIMLAISTAPASAEENDGYMSKGDKWAFGTEEDFSELFDQIYEEIQPELENETGDLIDITYDREGKIGFYYISEVLDDSNGMYKVESELGFYIHTYAEVNLDIQRIPEPGNHTDVTVSKDENGNTVWDGAPTSSRKLKGKGALDTVYRITSTNYYLQDTMDLDHMNVTFYSGVDFKLIGKNYPEFNYGNSTYNQQDDSETLEWMNVKYHDITLEGTISSDLNLNLGFSPAVNLFDLPIQEGDQWNGTTNVTVSGDLGGKIDIKEPQGIPNEIMEEFYLGVNSGLEGNEIDKTVTVWSDLFPINIPNDWILPEEAKENVTIENNRFVLEETTSPEPVEYFFKAGEKQNVTLLNGTEVEAFEIIPDIDEDYEDEPWTRGEDDDNDNEEGDDDNDNEEGDDDNDNEEGDDDNDHEEGDDDNDNDNNYKEEQPFEMKNFVSSEDGKLVKTEMESEIIESGELEMEAEPVEPSTAENAVNSKANPDEPKEGGVNAGRKIEFTDDDEGDDGSEMPGATTAVSVMSLMIASIYMDVKRRRR